nr:helix-turn-helix transcriptional regulator [Paenibacillus fonticola]
MDRNLNPSELARLTGHSPQYIHNLLNGNRRWNEDSMRKVCDTLGLELAVIPKEESEVLK